MRNARKVTRSRVHYNFGSQKRCQQEYTSFTNHLKKKSGKKPDHVPIKFKLPHYWFVIESSLYSSPEIFR